MARNQGGPNSSSPSSNSPDSGQQGDPGHSHGHAHAHDHVHPHSHDGDGDHGHTHEPHDWHSQSYVDRWIKRDESRDSERRPRIREMIALAKLPHEAAVSVLDVGAGYGFVTEEVLRAFPHARVTLQDFSDLMLARARRHLAERAAAACGQLRFVLCDLTDPGWPARVDGPFDLVVSAIAIHNLRQRAAIAACYRGIAQLLKPGALFLNCDLFGHTGGIESHIGLMQEAGMARVFRAWNDGHAAILVGHGRRSL